MDLSELNVKVRATTAAGRDARAFLAQLDLTAEEHDLVDRIIPDLTTAALDLFPPTVSDERIMHLASSALAVATRYADATDQHYKRLLAERDANKTT